MASTGSTLSSDQVARALAAQGQSRDTRFADNKKNLPLPWTKMEGEVVSWADTALRQAEEESSTLLSNRLIPRIIQYLSGNQWPSRPTAYGNSRPVTNRMFRQYWEIVSLLTDGKPEPEIKVYDGDEGYSEIQKTIGQLLEVWAAKPNYPDALQDIIGFGLLARGIGKVQWNRHLSGGMGDVEILSVNPLNFHTLGGDGSVENAECCVETRMVTIASLKRQFGHLADGIEPEPLGLPNSQVMRPRQLSSAEWGKLAPNMQRILGVKTGGGVNEQLFPMVRQRIYWLRDAAINETSQTVRVGKEYANWSYLVEPGMPLFPRGRLIVVAGRRVLNDTCNPYFHASHPYIEMIPLKPCWGADGMSLMGNLLGPQDIINRIMAGLLETIKAGLTPTIITPTGAISRGDLDNISTTISGGKLEYNIMRTGGQKPEFRKQPETPQLALPFLNMTMREMDQTTGSAAVDAAAQKEQIPSHDTMEMIQNSRSGMVRLMGRRLEGFLNRGGQMVVSCMLQYYSVGHRVALLGQKGITANDFSPIYGSMLSGGMMPEQFVRKFQFSIRPGSALSFDKETRAQMSTILTERGLLSRRNMFRSLNAAGASIDIKQNEDELIEEALIKIKLAALAGQAGGGGKGKK
jgi:hypothetical protein